MNDADVRAAQAARLRVIFGQGQPNDVLLPSEHAIRHASTFYLCAALETLSRYLQSGHLLTGAEKERRELVRATLAERDYITTR